MKKYLLIVTPLALVIYFLFQLTPSSLVIMMDKLYDYEHDMPDYTGYALLLQEGDTYHFRKGYGYANVPEKINLHPDKRFIAPGFQSFLIKAAFFNALQQSDISLDTKVYEIAPQYSIKDFPDATLRHVMAGTSGITDSSISANTTYAPVFEELEVMISFIEEKSSASYWEYIENTILTPAGCVSTLPADSEKAPEILPHMRSAGKYKPIKLTEVYTGIQTSLEDIQKIFNYIFSQKEYLNQLKVPMALENGEYPGEFGYWVDARLTPTVFGWMMDSGQGENYLVYDEILPQFAYTALYNPVLDKFFGVVGNSNGVGTFEKTLELYVIGNGYIHQLEQE